MRGALTTGEVHVWLVETAALDPVSVSHWSQGLPAAERAQLEAFYRPEDRHAHRVTALLVRHAVGSSLGVHPAEIVLSRDEQGRPYSPQAADEGLDFNASQTRWLVGCAIAREATVGLDLERVEPLDAHELEAVAARCFRRVECEELRQLEPTHRLTRFYELWTRYEARIKAQPVTPSPPSARLQLETLPTLGDHRGAVGIRDGARSERHLVVQEVGLEALLAPWCTAGRASVAAAAAPAGQDAA